MNTLIQTTNQPNTIYNDKLPTNWEELTEIVKNLNDFPRELLRNEMDELYNQKFQATIPKNLNNALIEQMLQVQSPIILNPLFPYTQLLSKVLNVKHLLLWHTSELSSTQITQILNSEFPNKEYLWHRNSTQNQSMKKIWHVHVFLKM